MALIEEPYGSQLSPSRVAAAWRPEAVDPISVDAVEIAARELDRRL